MDRNECQAYSLDQAVAEGIIPGNPSRQTAYRWCTIGCRGVRLDHLHVGKKICITPAAIAKFGRELAEAWNRPQAPTVNDHKPKRKTTQGQRAKALQDARNTLQKNGVLS